MTEEIKDLFITIGKGALLISLMVLGVKFPYYIIKGLLGFGIAFIIMYVIVKIKNKKEKEEDE